MILTLKKPINPGDFDAGKLYTHLHLELIVYNSSAYVVQLSYTYGTIEEGGVFKQGAAAQTQSATVEGADLDDFSKQMAGQGEPALAASVRLAYRHVMDKLGIEGDLNYELPQERKATEQEPPAESATEEKPAESEPEGAS